MKNISGILLLLFCSAFLAAQEPAFSSLYSELDELDQTMALIEQSMNRQSGMLKDLERKLDASDQSIADLKSISETQGQYVNSLLEKMKLQERIRQEQLKYQKKLERQLLGWKIGSVTVGIVSVAAITGIAVWTLTK